MSKSIICVYLIFQLISQCQSVQALKELGKNEEYKGSGFSSKYDNSDPKVHFLLRISHALVATSVGMTLGSVAGSALLENSPDLQESALKILNKAKLCMKSVRVNLLLAKGEKRILTEVNEAKEEEEDSEETLYKEPLRYTLQDIENREKVDQKLLAKKEEEIKAEGLPSEEEARDLLFASTQMRRRHIEMRIALSIEQWSDEAYDLEDSYSKFIEKGDETVGSIEELPYVDEKNQIETLEEIMADMTELENFASSETEYTEKFIIDETDRLMEIFTRNGIDDETKVSQLFLEVYIFKLRDLLGVTKEELTHYVINLDRTFSLYKQFQELLTKVQETIFVAHSTHPRFDNRLIL